MSSDRIFMFAASAGPSQIAFHTLPCGLLTVSFALLICRLPGYPIPLHRKLYVCFRRGLGFLLETMQHVDCVGKLRHIDHAERPAVLAYSDFLGSRPYRRQRLPIVRLQAALHPKQLVSRFATGVLGKLLQVLQGGTDESTGFERLSHAAYYIRIDIFHKPICSDSGPFVPRVGRPLPQQGDAPIGAEPRRQMIARGFKPV
jgi:hypothetical protein